VARSVQPRYHQGAASRPKHAVPSSPIEPNVNQRFKAGGPATQRLCRPLQRARRWPLPLAGPQCRAAVTAPLPSGRRVAEVPQGSTKVKPMQARVIGWQIGGFAHQVQGQLPHDLRRVSVFMRPMLSGSNRRSRKAKIRSNLWAGTRLSVRRPPIPTRRERCGNGPARRQRMISRAPTDPGQFPVGPQNQLRSAAFHQRDAVCRPAFPGRASASSNAPTRPSHSLRVWVGIAASGLPPIVEDCGFTHSALGLGRQINPAPASIGRAGTHRSFLRRPLQAATAIH